MKPIDRLRLSYGRDGSRGRRGDRGGLGRGADGGRAAARRAAQRPPPAVGVSARGGAGGEHLGGGGGVACIAAGIVAGAGRTGATAERDALRKGRAGAAANGGRDGGAAL